MGAVDMSLGYLHPINQFCDYFKDRAVTVVNQVIGSVSILNSSDTTILHCIASASDFKDEDLLSILPLCIAYMLSHPEDDCEAPYAFLTYCQEFDRLSSRMDLTDENLSETCGEQTAQLLHMVNAILQMRLIQDDDGTISIAVGVMKRALSGIRYRRR